jgi:hypothetical protein
MPDGLAAMQYATSQRSRRRDLVARPQVDRRLRQPVERDQLTPREGLGEAAADAGLARRPVDRERRRPGNE